jgi:L-threonylcarbamoyladenylate synthase
MDENKIKQEVEKAADIVRNGGIILFPSDTTWSIGCDASNDQAVERIFNLKKQKPGTGMITLVNGERQMHQIFSNIPEVAWQIIDFAQKPTTLILDNPRNIAPKIIGPENSLGIRIIKTRFCFNLIERLKKPMVSTLPHLVGAPIPLQFSEISPVISNGVDYIVNLDRELSTQKPSNIIKLTTDSQVKIIRR